MASKTTSLSMRAKVFFSIYIVLAMILAVWIGTMLPQQGAAAQDQNDQQFLHDGPYVFWLGDSAIVKQLCGGEVITSVYKTGQSIEIVRECGDTLPTLLISGLAPTQEPDNYTNIPKIFAVSDIHGRFDTLLALLRGNGIIDDDLRWTWDTGHLVFVGDIFDRGSKMTEVLWFIYRLEKEARKAGGNVHLILGNHELLVLRNDIRYVHEKYKALTIKKLRIRMSDLYGPETELGRWLRSKNIIFKINDILFVHGGVSPKLMSEGYTIKRINSEIRNGMDVRDYTLRFDKKLTLLFGSQGPLWYRGYFSRNDNPPATTKQIDSLLTFYEAGHIVVGHTGVETITAMYEDRVFAIETGMNRGAPGEGLFWENNKFYMCDAAGNQTLLK